MREGLRLNQRERVLLTLAVSKVNKDLQELQLPLVEPSALLHIILENGLQHIHVTRNGSLSVTPK